MDNQIGLNWIYFRENDPNGVCKKWRFNFSDTHEVKNINSMGQIDEIENIIDNKEIPFLDKQEHIESILNRKENRIKKEWINFKNILSKTYKSIWNIRVNAIVGKNWSWKTSLLFWYESFSSFPYLKWINLNPDKKGLIFLWWAYIPSDNHLRFFYKLSLIKKTDKLFFENLSKYFSENFWRHILVTEAELKTDFYIPYATSRKKKDSTWDTFSKERTIKHFVFWNYILTKNKKWLEENFKIDNASFILEIINQDQIKSFITKHKDWIIQNERRCWLEWKVSAFANNKKTKDSYIDNQINVHINQCNVINTFDYSHIDLQEAEFASNLAYNERWRHRLDRKLYLWDILFNKISSGERRIISFLCDISYKVINSRSNNFIILFDEPDNHLHINRQRKFIATITNFLWSDLFQWKSFQLILATHSPYIVSDLPVNNIIFLEDWRDVSKRYKEKWQTLWANTIQIINDFLWADNTIWSIVEDCIKKYVDMLKVCNALLYTVENVSEKKHLYQLIKKQREVIEEYWFNQKKYWIKYQWQWLDNIITNIKEVRKYHIEEYKDIIWSIWDNFLRSHLIGL